MVGWDEILNPDLPSTAVVQSWRGLESLPQTLRSGHHAILSAPYYLDQMYAAEDHYVDPLPDSLGLTPEEAGRMLGGEACMWGEHTGPATIDSRLWPRLAAVAEKLWSSAEVTDVHDMYRRLRIVSVRLEELGLGHTTHTERMLRRVVGKGPDEQALAALLRLSQPVTFGQRNRLQVGMTQQTPLTGLVDAALPDPPARWDWLTVIERYLADSGRTPAIGDSLRQAFKDLARAGARHPERAHGGRLGRETGGGRAGPRGGGRSRCHGSTRRYGRADALVAGFGARRARFCRTAAGIAAPCRGGRSAVVGRGGAGQALAPLCTCRPMSSPAG